MRLRKLIKRFRFIEEKRAELTLGTGVRLDPVLNVVTLEADANGHYPTAAGLKLYTWVANPDSLKQWLLFQVDILNAKHDAVTVTGAGYRLSDGVDEYWWDGASWVVDLASWNTEAEVSANIQSFPVTSKKLQLVINLWTTNKLYTPVLRQAKVLWSSDIEFHDDLVYRSFVRQLRSQVRPIGDYPVSIDVTANTIDLKNDYPLETPYNVVGVEAVYNDTVDPEHQSDLYQSYDSNTQVITLSSSIQAGEVAWIKFTWEPEIAVLTTSQDYSEISRIPAIVLSDINLLEATELGQDDEVIDKATNAGTKIPAPLQGDLEIRIRAITDSGRDHFRLADELIRFFANNPMLRSKGLDELYRMWAIEEYDAATVPSRGELHVSRLLLRISKALFYHKDAVDAHGVKALHLTGDVNTVIEA